MFHSSACSKRCWLSSSSGYLIFLLPRSFFPYQITTGACRLSRSATELAGPSLVGMGCTHQSRPEGGWP